MSRPSPFHLYIKIGQSIFSISKPALKNQHSHIILNHSNQAPKLRTVGKMMQHPCRGCSQTFSDPYIILICAPLGGYICSLESPLRRTSPLPPSIASRTTTRNPQNYQQPIASTASPIQRHNINTLNSNLNVMSSLPLPLPLKHSCV